MSFAAIRVVALGGTIAVALACDTSGSNRPVAAECTSPEAVPTAAEFVPGDVIVGFRESPSKAEAVRLLDGYGLSYRLSLGWAWGLPSAKVCVGPGQEEDWIERFLKDEMVEYAHLNHIGHIQGEGESR